MFGSRYVAFDGLTRGQARGNLWMTPLLGAPLLVRETASSLVQLTGRDEQGDVRSGTGLALDPTHILTAKHVVEDMVIDETLTVPNTAVGTAEVRVVDTLPHPDHDLAIIVTAGEVDSLTPVPGLVSCDPDWSDSLYVLGYPPVPMSAAAELTVQSGEVVNPILSTYDGAELFLFSAVARPGNSGGPIVGGDGRLRGMVTQELSLQAASSPAPFYAGVPAKVIHACLADLEMAHLLRAETWA